MSKQKKTLKIEPINQLFLYIIKNSMIIDKEVEIKIGSKNFEY